MGKASTAITIILTLGLATAAQAYERLTLPVSIGFESAEGYTTGPLLDDGFRTTANPGQGPWYGEDLAASYQFVDINDGAIGSSSAAISTDFAHTGTQSLRIGAETHDAGGDAPYSNTYKYYSVDFPTTTSGTVSVEWWFYIEVAESTGRVSTETPLMYVNLADRDVAAQIESINNNLNPDKLRYPSGANWVNVATYTAVTTENEWRGLRAHYNLDTGRYSIESSQAPDGSTASEWQPIDQATDLPFYDSLPYNASTPSLGTWNVYMLSWGEASTSFNGTTGLYIDDVSIFTEIAGDFDGDGDSDSDDIDLLLANLTGENVYNEDYDLDGDYDADQEDLVKYIRNIMNTEFGDWNLDGSVDLADFNLWLGSDGTGGWAEGDGNGDGFNDLADFNMWLGESPPTDSQAFLTPEPATLLFFGAAAGALALRRTTRAREPAPGKQ